MIRTALVVTLALFARGACCFSSETQQSKAPAEDDIVLELVLSDLTTYEGRGRPLSLKREIPRTIQFSRVVPRRPFCSEPLTQQKVWPLMNEDEQMLTCCAIADAKSRHTGSPSVWSTRLFNDRIYIVEDPKLHAVDSTFLSYGALFPITAWPPGYSGNRLCAVLHLHFAETFHPSSATYVVVREPGGRWRIKYRAFSTHV